MPSNSVPTLSPNGHAGNTKPDPSFMHMLEHNTTLHVVGIIFFGLCLIALAVVIFSGAREAIESRLRPRGKITFDHDDH